MPSAVNGMANRFQHIVSLWRELPVPITPAVHGVASAAASESLLGAALLTACGFGPVGPLSGGGTVDCARDYSGSIVFG
jgi:hypothetical protein